MALVREYQNDMLRREMLLYEEEIKLVPEYYENMLLYNEIEQVIPYTVRQVDHQKWFVYNTTGKQSVSESLLHQKIGYEQLRELCTEMIRLINHCREYLLDEKDFLLHPEYLFWQDYAKPLYLCVFPGYGREVKEQLTELLEFFMNRIDYNDRRAVMMVYELYMKSKEESCTFDDILGIIKKNEGIAEEKVSDYVAETPFSIKSKPVEETVAPKVMYMRESVGSTANKESPKGWKQYLPDFLIQAKKQKEKQKREKYKKRSEEEPKTRLLYQGVKASLYCLRSETQESESIYIPKFPYYIGKPGANVDYEMTVPTISRIHARLTQMGEDIYLEDMQSTNGTFVNDVRLIVNEVKKLENGDRVKFADRNYHYEKQ